MLMWGAWHVYAQDEPWRKEARKARLVLETPADCAVLFSTPVCQLIHASDLATHPTSKHAGLSWDHADRLADQPI